MLLLPRHLLTTTSLHQIYQTNIVQPYIFLIRFKMLVQDSIPIQKVRFYRYCIGSKNILLSFDIYGI